MKREDEIWLYCWNEDNKIVLFRSKDGINWYEEGIVYERGGLVTDPSVTFYKGKYYMVVTIS